MLLLENTFLTIPLSRQNVHQFQQEFAEHLWACGGKMDLKAAQKLMHGLGGSWPHLRAVLAHPIGTATRQEAHKDMDQGGIRHHLLRCAFVTAHAIVGGWKFKQVL